MHRRIACGFLTAGIAVLFLFPEVYGCGGGVVPYVPTQSGASTASSASSGQFFLFEKGVAVDMFNVQQHQPIFRHIVLSGNERKDRSTRGHAVADSSAVAADSTAAAKEAAPVLNLHRLH